MSLVRNIKIFFLVCLIVVSVSGCSSDAAVKMLNDADQEFKNGNYDAAKKIYTDVVSKYSSYEEAGKAKTALADYDTKVVFDKKSKEEELERKQKEEAERQASQKKLAESYNEMLNAFNLVYSKNNFKEVYAGVRFNPSSNTLTVTVNDYWSLLSKDIKIGFVKQAMNIWAGMHGARKLPFDADGFNLKVVHNQSDRTVAKWGSILGTRIED